MRVTNILAKFASRKLAVVLATIGVAVAPKLIEKTSGALDWKVYALAGVYIVFNVVQHIVCTYIETTKKG
jgi:hypothetical protein